MARYSKQKSRMNRDEHPAFVPMLKTVEQMALISGIGENKLRQLMADGELEFIQNGNRRLISEQAIWDYYNRAKTPARSVTLYKLLSLRAGNHELWATIRATNGILQQIIVASGFWLVIVLA